MKKGLTDILACKQSGMPGLHMLAIQLVANTYNVVIGVRPVNKYAVALIEAGYPTKPYVVKNHSIKKRPSVLAGLIAISPEYSQIEESEFQTHVDQLQSAFAHDKDLRKTHCVLSEERIHELKTFFGDAIQIQFLSEKNEYSISWKRQEKTITVCAKKNNADDDYTIHDDKGELLQVLGKVIVNQYGEKSVKPVTADYDLLVICPTYSALDSQKNFSREIIAAINAQIATIDMSRKGVNLETVQHNTEFENPFPLDPADNLPCLIFLPYPLGFTEFARETIIMIETRQELREIFEIIHQKNYYWAPHTSYPELRVPKHILNYN